MAYREQIMMKSMLPKTRYYIAFFLVTLLLCGAQYIELYQGVNPCPLCILQRLTLGLLGIVFLFGLACGRKKCGGAIIALFSFLVSALGIVLSGRQVWMQFAPSTGLSANCDVSLQYLIHALPFDQVITRIFAGGAECSQVTWTFLHVSLAQWSLFWFVLFALFSLRQLFGRK